MKAVGFALAAVLLVVAGVLGWLFWSVRGELNTLKDSQAKMQEELGRYRTEAEQGKGRLKGLTADREQAETAAKAQLDDLNKKLTLAQGQLDKAVKDLAPLRAYKTDTEEQIKRFEGELKKVRGDLRTAVAEQQKLSEKNDELSRKVGDGEKALKEEKKKTESLETKLKKLGSRGFLMIDDADRYNKTKTRTVEVVYRKGKRADALALGKKLGFTVTYELESARLLHFRWPETATMTRETLAALQDAWPVFALVQPYVPARRPPPAAGAPSGDGAPAASRAGRRSAEGHPDDEFYDQQWGLRAINAPRAWKKGTASRVLVAVIDSGFDLEHEDLKDGFEMKFAENFLEVKRPPLPFDDRRRDNRLDVNNVIHGTHVAGIIGAVGNNKRGVTGVCWAARMIPMRAVGQPRGEKVHERPVLAALDAAVKRRAKVINLSIDRPYPRREPGVTDEDHGRDVTEHETEANILWLTVQRILEEHDVLIVCAAGNEGRNNEDPNNKNRVLSSPSHVSHLAAEYDPNNTRLKGAVISVMAATRAGPNDEVGPWKQSNFGVNRVDIAAPGDAILSTVPRKAELITRIDQYATEGKDIRDRYHILSGTSQAAPYVSGAAALIWSLPGNEKLTPHAVKKLLLDKARRVPALADKCPEGRFLDLAFVNPPRPPIASTPPSFHDGYAAYWAGDYQEAVRAFADAVEESPVHAGSYYYLAFANACLGRERPATEALFEALAIEEQYPLQHRTDYWRNWSVLMERLQGRKRWLLSDLRARHMAEPSSRTAALPSGFWAGWCDRTPSGAGSWFRLARPMGCRGG